jgi:proteasome lid subunit RPN8/RPN11
MHPKIKADIIGLAKAEPDREVCGFIYVDAQNEAAILPCANIAANPTEEFLISDEDHMRAMGYKRILGVYHSHPNSPGFSPEDLGCAEAMGVPFYLYCVKSETWQSYLPESYDPPLAGRQFVVGFEDCYELVRLYFRQKGHHMNDYDRDRTLNLKDLILDRFQVEGFTEIPVNQATYGDVFMFKSDRVLSNHFGILIGPSKMLHHPIGGLSCEEMVTDRWLSRLTHVFRLKQG